MKEKTVFLFLSAMEQGKKSDGEILHFANIYAQHAGIYPTPQRIIREGGQKPRFEPKTLEFSLSHSRDFWALALCDAPVGLDVERVACTRNFNAIARRFFTPLEAEYIQSNPTDFYPLWCAKEAWVKLWGTGIAKGFRQTTLAATGHGITDNLDGYSRHVMTLNGEYHLCLWAPRGYNVKIIQAE